MKRVFVPALVIATIVAAWVASGKSRSTGVVMDDTSLATRTKAALLADAVTDGLNIDVEVNRDQVQLNGFVDSAAERDAAVATVRNVAGVTKVVNNLKLR